MLEQPVSIVGWLCIHRNGGGYTVLIRPFQAYRALKHHLPSIMRALSVTLCARYFLFETAMPCCACMSLVAWTTSRAALENGTVRKIDSNNCRGKLEPQKTCQLDYILGLCMPKLPFGYKAHRSEGRRINLATWGSLTCIQYMVQACLLFLECSRIGIRLQCERPLQRKVQSA